LSLFRENLIKIESLYFIFLMKNDLKGRRKKKDLM